jgi:hypothetical protein
VDYVFLLMDLILNGFYEMFHLLVYWYEDLDK